MKGGAGGGAMTRLPKHDSPAVQSAAEVEASQPVEQKGTDRNICLLLEQKALPRPPLL